MVRDLFERNGSDDATPLRDLFATEDPQSEGVAPANAGVAAASGARSSGLLDQLGENLMAGPLTGPLIRAGHKAANYTISTPPQEQLGDLLRFQDNSMRAIASGATFGFADELAAGANTLTGLGADSYEENVAAERARDEQIPLAQRIPGEIAGGLATGGAVGTALRGTQIMNAASKLPQFLQATGSGGLYGAAYGAGTSEGDAIERLPDAAMGGLLGAGTGLAFNLASRAIGATGGAVGSAIENRSNPRVAAQKQISQAIARDESTPRQVAARLKRLGSQATLADAGGENLRSLARATAGVPGPAKERARSVFNTRAFGESSRVQEAVKSGTKAQEYFAASDELMNNLKTRAAPLYNRAYAQGLRLESPKLTKLLGRPIAKDAMLEASELARLEGRRLSRLDPSLTAQAKEAVQRGLMDPATVPKGGVGRGITTEALDDLKRGLDSLLDKPAYRNQLTGGLNKRGKILNDFKRELVGEADNLNPAYREARMAYKGDAEMLQALEKGTKFKRMSAEELRRTLADLTPAEQQAFKNGAVRELLTDINKIGDTRSVALKLGGNREIREKMRALISDPQEFRDFTRLLVQEGRFQNTRNMVLGGSQTAPRQAELADMAGDVAADMATGQPGSTALMRRAMEFINRPHSQVAGELAPALFTRGQAANQQTLEGLSPVVQQALQKRIQDQLARSQGIGGAALIGQTQR